MSATESLNPRLVFVGGAPRSGTTLVQKILSLHPQVFAGPEFDHLPHIAKLYTAMKNGIANGRQTQFYDSKALRSAFQNLVLATLCANATAKSADVLCEKTPDNALAFETLRELFPSARFIAVYRDPRAILNSFREVAQRAKVEGREVGVGSLPKDTRRVMKSIEAMSKFHEDATCGSVHNIYYEDLVKQPDVEAERLCKFLEISFVKEMLETDTKTPSSSLIANDNVWYTSQMFDRKISSDSLDRWRSELKASSIAYVEKACSKKNIPELMRYHMSPPTQAQGIWLSRLDLLDKFRSAVSRITAGYRRERQSTV